MIKKAAPRMWSGLFYAYGEIRQFGNDYRCSNGAQV